MPICNEIVKKSDCEKVKFIKDFFKKKTLESLKKYRNRKNYCSRLYKKEHKKFFINLGSSKICDNKTFWKTIQPFFLKNEKLHTKLLL